MLFLGIDLMQTGMLNTSQTFELGNFSAGTFLGRTILVFIGVLMTVVMQSSSAALAITLTAVSAGSIQLPDAAAMAIGQNMGTTVTAIIGSIDTGANAKRTTLAHVLFNVITGIIALALFGPFLAAVNWSAHQLGFFDAPSLLAMFHTGFNVLGVALMMPLLNIKIRYLTKWVKDKPLTVGQPKYLAINIIPYPELALEAAEKEYRHLQEIVSSTLIKALKPISDEVQALENQNKIAQYNKFIDELVLAITNFLEKIKRVTPEVTTKIFALMHLTEHLKTVTQMAYMASQSRARFIAPPEELKEPLAYLEQVVRQSSLQLVDHQISRETRTEILSHSQELARDSRDEIRKKLYSAAAEGSITPGMGLYIANYVNALERAVYHLYRAEYYWLAQEKDKGVIP